MTELLQSRVVSNGVEKMQQPKHVDFVIRSSRQDILPSGGNQSEAQRWRQDLQKSREERENSIRTLTVYENGGLSSATQAGVPEVNAICDLCLTKATSAHIFLILFTGF